MTTGWMVMLAATWAMLAMDTPLLQMALGILILSASGLLILFPILIWDGCSLFVSLWSVPVGLLANFVCVLSIGAGDAMIVLGFAAGALIHAGFVSAVIRPVPMMLLISTAGSAIFGVAVAKILYNNELYWAGEIVHFHLLAVISTSYYSSLAACLSAVIWDDTSHPKFEPADTTPRTNSEP